MPRSQREVAHFALDPAWTAPAATGRDALFEDFVQDARVKRFALPRGE